MPVYAISFLKRHGRRNASSHHDTAATILPTTQSAATQAEKQHDAITCPTTAANGKYSRPYPRAAPLFAAEGTAPLVDSRTSEAAEAVAERRASRRRAVREGRETAEEDGHEERRRDGRWGREVESAVAVAIEARQLCLWVRALSFHLILVSNGNRVERISTARSARLFLFDLTTRVI